MKCPYSPRATVAGVFVLFVWAGSSWAQTSSAPILAAAEQLNGLAPQAVAQQTIKLGILDGSTKQFTWLLPDYYPPNTPNYKKAEYGGPMQPQHRPEINSFNVRYEITIKNKPSNLKIVLTVPDANGKMVEKPATIGSNSAHVDFNPHSMAFQNLSITYSGGGNHQLRLTPHLNEQLGAFVVPHLLISIVYVPPGGLSSASYIRTRTAGTVVSWGGSRSSGLVTTEDPEAIFNLFNTAVAGGLAAAGFEPAAKAWTIISDLREQTKTTVTSTETRADSRSRGHFVSLTEEAGTAKHDYPGKSDIFVVLQDVMFVYAVHEGKVRLAPIAYSRLRKLTADEMSSQFPAASVQQFVALDPMLSAEPPSWSNPPGPTPGVSTSTALREVRNIRMLGAPRFRYYGEFVAEQSAYGGYTISHEEFNASGTTEVKTSTVVTHVSGLAKMIAGGGDETYSVSYFNSREQISSDEHAATLKLQCGPDEPAFLVRVYYDTTFRTFLCVRGPDIGSEEQAMVAGTVEDSRNRPVPGKQVTLRIGENRYTVMSDANGKFRFPFESMPKGAGTISVGSSKVQVNYEGTPMRNLKLGGVAEQERQQEAEPKRSPPITRGKEVPKRAGPATAKRTTPAGVTPPRGLPGARGAAPAARAYSVTPNPQARGRMGKLVITFPEGSNPASTRYELFPAADPKKTIKSGYGNQSIDLLPGQYIVSISNKRVENVPIESRNETRLHVGLLHIHADANTRVRLLDKDQKTELTSGYGEQQIGLPAGQYFIEVAGQAEPITVEAGKVADF